MVSYATSLLVYSVCFLYVFILLFVLTQILKILRDIMPQLTYCDDVGFSNS